MGLFGGAAGGCGVWVCVVKSVRECLAKRWWQRWSELESVSYMAMGIECRVAAAAAQDLVVP